MHHRSEVAPTRLAGVGGHDLERLPRWHSETEQPDAELNLVGRGLLAQLFAESEDHRTAVVHRERCVSLFPCLGHGEGDEASTHGPSAGTAVR